MPIVIVEGTSTHTMDITYEELLSAYNYAVKERERHRLKALKSYYKKKEKKKSEEEIPPASDA